MLIISVVKLKGLKVAGNLKILSNSLTTIQLKTKLTPKQMVIIKIKDLKGKLIIKNKV